MVALALALAPVGLAEEETLTAEIDAVLAANYPMDEPGAVVIIVKDGDLLFRKAYGMANFELDIPLAPDMVFRIGSITKQFTAALFDDGFKDRPKGGRLVARPPSLSADPLLCHRESKLYFWKQYKRRLGKLHWSSSSSGATSNRLLVHLPF